MNSPAPARDAGETLIEILVSVVILGIAVAAILGGIGMSATASSTHQSLSRTQNLLRDWAETLTWGPVCAVSPFAVPAGYTTDSSPTVSPWNGTSKTFEGACTGDAEVYRVELGITPPATQGPALRQTLDVVVRQPCATAGLTPC